MTKWPVLNKQKEQHIDIQKLKTYICNIHLEYKIFCVFMDLAILVHILFIKMFSPKNWGTAFVRSMTFIAQKDAHKKCWMIWCV